MACLEKSLSSCGQMDLLEIVPGPVALQHGIDWERRGTREKDNDSLLSLEKGCEVRSAFVEQQEGSAGCSDSHCLSGGAKPVPLDRLGCPGHAPLHPCNAASRLPSYRCQEFPSRNHKLDLDVAQFSDGDCRELGGPDDPADPKKTSRQWHQSGFAFMYHDSSSPWDAMMVTPEGRNYGTALASFSADENNLRVCLRAREALVTRVNRKPDLKGDTDDNGEEAPLCGGEEHRKGEVLWALAPRAPSMKVSEKLHGASVWKLGELFAALAPN
ncbi:uncharacterized protein CIMG_12209 [Coccidioides immitis RS]|uniref:Uncharacterized protein n=1 Tax=Coccidioides immitis (strain RS) TaxID=246410 RepID=A0A0D8JTR7_COCIM|nr:uncharacterized protein CIMG_12209 [Coccidioides immitis RS]KJF60730.1 hypothetical protein CIMG_12209 [Coccidioides immitis RS]